MTNSKLFNSTLFLIMSTISLSSTSYAQSNSDPKEFFITSADGKRFWQAEVICSNESGSRYIEKQIDSNRWCLKSLPTSCFDDKSIAVEQACSGVVSASAPIQTSTSSVTTTVPAPQESIAATPVVANNISDEEEDDDDDFYYDINALTLEKQQLEAQLQQIKAKQADYNRRLNELQSSLATY